MVSAFRANWLIIMATLSIARHTFIFPRRVNRKLISALTVACFIMTYHLLFHMSFLPSVLHVRMLSTNDIFYSSPDLFCLQRFPPASAPLSVVMLHDHIAEAFFVLRYLAVIGWFVICAEPIHSLDGPVFNP